MEGDEVRAALWPALSPPQRRSHIKFYSHSIVAAMWFYVRVGAMAGWRTLNTGPEQPLTYSPHIYKASVLRCVALLPLGSGVWRVVAVVVVVVVGVTVVSPVNLRGAREFFVLYSFNNWFPFCTPQPHFLGAGSLILLLFKSNTSDYGVLPVHSTAKIRHKTEKEDSECELAGN